MKTIGSFILLILICTTLPALQFARWHTSMGDFTCKLYDDIVPITAGNFIDLANSGFYNNLIFHRVVAGFVIQDGCPYGTGYGGPGYTIPDEFSPLLNHNQAGTLAMARTSAPNSAGSQYYITLEPTPHLNGSYAVFGQVIEGLDTVLAIGLVPTNANGLPNTPVNIHSVSIVDLDIGSITPDNADTLHLEPGVSQMFIVEATSEDFQHSFKWFLGGEELVGQTDFLLEMALPAEAESPLVCRVSQGDFNYDIVWNFDFPTSNQDSSAPQALPQVMATPNPFRESLNLKFSTAEAGPAALSIFNLRGQRVYSDRQNLSRGDHSLVWDGRDNSGHKLTTGLYLYRLESGGAVRCGKLLKLQ